MASNGVHMFHVREGLVSAAEARRIQRIAQEHGADFFAAEGRYWFTCENLGDPFNGATARAVMAAVGTITARSRYASARKAAR